MRSAFKALRKAVFSRDNEEACVVDSQWILERNSEDLPSSFRTRNHEDIRRFQERKIARYLDPASQTKQNRRRSRLTHCADFKQSRMRNFRRGHAKLPSYRDGISERDGIYRVMKRSKSRKSHPTKDPALKHPTVDTKGDSYHILGMLTELQQKSLLPCTPVDSDREPTKCLFAEVTDLEYAGGGYSDSSCDYDSDESRSTLRTEPENNNSLRKVAPPSILDGRRDIGSETRINCHGHDAVFDREDKPGFYACEDAVAHAISQLPTSNEHEIEKTNSNEITAANMRSALEMWRQREIQRGASPSTASQHPALTQFAENEPIESRSTAISPRVEDSTEVARKSLVQCPAVCDNKRMIGNEEQKEKDLDELNPNYGRLSAVMDRLTIKIPLLDDEKSAKQASSEKSSFFDEAAVSKRTVKNKVSDFYLQEIDRRHRSGIRGMSKRSAFPRENRDFKARGSRRKEVKNARAIPTEWLNASTKD